LRAGNRGFSRNFGKIRAKWRLACLLQRFRQNKQEFPEAKMEANKMTPVILAGGTGARLWPVSRDSLPKQFAAFSDGPSLFQQTLKRVCDRSLFEPPLVIAHRRYAGLVKDQLAQAGCTDARIVFESANRETAASLALAIELAGPARTPMLVLPADHAINDNFAFLRSIAGARSLALRNACIVALGIRPAHPETAHGYLRAGAPIHGEPGFLLDVLVESPAPELAATLIRTPGVYRHSGIFIFEPQLVRTEMEIHASDILAHVRRSVVAGKWEDNQFHPDAACFEAAAALTFEQALYSRTGHAAVAPADPGWSDLGSWKAVWENAPQDSNRNVVSGKSYCVNTTNSLVISDGPVVGVAGLEDVVVVASRDAILVTSRSDPRHVGKLVDEMRADGIGAVFTHARENRKWGSIESIDRGESHQVRRITLDAGGCLPLQYHHHRSEHWIVVAGLATVTIDGQVMMMGPCQQLFIAQGSEHKLENLGGETVDLIQVQYGHYLGEDDVVHVEEPARQAFARRADRVTKAA
jgi:mannose-1-phosphate guanylyltransferase/mannose-6-phosphate isomerase